MISIAAENGIIAVQLKLGVAVALDLDGCGVSIPTPMGVWLPNVHIPQGHIGGVALVFGGNGDGVGSGLGLAGGLVFGGQDDVGIFVVTNIFSIAILHIDAFVLIRPLGDTLFAVRSKDVHTALGQIVSVRKGCCGDGRDHGHQSRCGQHPQGKLLFHIFPHCKTLQTKKLTETRTLPGTMPKTGKNRNFGAEKHIAVHFHARRLFVAQV